ncbi:glycosyltransferase [Cellulomonas sp. ICMP 17802]|uniref:glycosyltransferase n=1 Tax=Cellulomonas sp. ICMP 17802 TaxID=3239199 RepID=UPI00351AB485
MRDLIVHEWISATGGSEKVLDRLVGVLPDAQVVCLWDDDPGRYPGREVVESWVAKTPLRGRKALSIPASLAAWRTLNVGEVDRIVVSSHAFAHHARPLRRAADAQKFVYVHTPARYLWAPELDVRGSGAAVKAVSPLLRGIDRRRASEPSSIAANSRYVRDRIRAAWDRDADVIYPPVDVARIQSVSDWRDELGPGDLAELDALPAQYLIGASRFVSYKRLDLVIDAGEASGLPVVIAGSGPEEGRLRERASAATVPVTFVRRPSDALLFALLQHAVAFVFPAIEDFGILPVEAMACGTPVIVNAIGGAPESVEAPLGGAVVESFTSVELARAVSAASSVDRKLVARHSRQFSAERFDAELLHWLNGEVIDLGRAAPGEAAA